MRLYENLITTNLALFDLPIKTYDRTKESYLDKIFRQLLIFDQMPDNDLEGVVREAGNSLAMKDPAFEILFHNDFEQYINGKRHWARWEKTRKDYGYYLDSEVKRRNKENPYHVTAPDNLESWENVPDFSKQKHNQPWQFDYMYRDAQKLAAAVHELTKNYKAKQDKDLFRAKINSILVPDKIIFALNSGENLFDFVESEITVISIKMSLDAYKLAYSFLNRVIESLHKMRWSKGAAESAIDESIKMADHMSETILPRILELEKRFILFLDSLASSELL